MILAVVDYIEDGRPPPPDLKALLDFRLWNRLPRAGGILNQRAGQLDRMLVCGYIHDLWKLVTEHPERWTKIPADSWETFLAIKEHREKLASGESLVSS